MPIFLEKQATFSTMQILQFIQFKKIQKKYYITILLSLFILVCYTVCCEKSCQNPAIFLVTVPTQQAIRESQLARKLVAEADTKNRSPFFLFFEKYRYPEQGREYEAIEPEQAVRILRKIGRLLSKKKILLALNALDQRGQTPLHYAVSHAGLAVIQWLLQAGAAVHVADQEGRVPLHEAVKNPDPAVIQWLIKKGAVVHVADLMGRVPLHEAAEKGCTGTVQVLVDSQAAVQVADQAGKTPLHVAARHGQLGSASVLLGAGADIDLLDEDGNTPLHTAVLYGRADVFLFLLDKGADRLKRNKQGKTAQELAAERGYHTLLQCFK